MKSKVNYIQLITIIDLVHKHLKRQKGAVFGTAWNHFSVEKGALKNFVNFAGKHLCWSLILIKLQLY